MKLLTLFACLLFLAGCSTTASHWETVSDIHTAEPCHWSETAFGISYGIPENLQTSCTSSDGVRYEINGGELIVSSEVLLTSDVETAISQLTNQEARDLSVIELERFGLPEYRFTWCETTEEGQLRLYTADLVLDDIYGYALLCSTDTSVGNQYDHQIETVFSTFGLYFDETM